MPRQVQERPVPAALRAEVRAVASVSPHVRRVTLGGLDRFEACGHDQWFRLFLPRTDRAVGRLPGASDWWQEILRMPEEERPVVRNYSVRAARPDRAEIDVDFVVHRDEGGVEGFASRWAGRAEPGDVVGVLDQGATVPPAADWWLLAGDETALPAIASLVDSAPAGRRVLVAVELPAAADAQPLRTGPGITVDWLVRADGEVPGTRLHEAVGQAAFPPGRPWVWLAGESNLVRTVRRELVSAHRISKADISFTGYWRRGRHAIT